ncbi:LytR/AlgR family response regulator transcription factor [Mariniflexile sp. HMF6888]|uniref:LytR/AlgR family response regulator transcription factor n=1 Tax=Mariniflexile sp. HMF6888 TaxID=3373086 RepID=UPI0037B265AA
MKISTIIVDDEPLARQRVIKLLENVEEITLIEECSTGKKAIQVINELTPALVFLDIKLKDMTGFKVLENISPDIKPIVIFITAYDEFAIKAFDYFALDYLQKPFREDRFMKSVNKAIEVIKEKHHLLFDNKIKNILDYLNTQEEKKNFTKKIPIKIGNKILFIEVQDIIYITASGYYAEIFTENKKYLLRDSLNNLITQLNSNNFLRIHRSTIINLNYINELINSNYGEIDVKMNDNKLFRISKSYKKDFTNAMGL